MMARMIAHSILGWTVALFFLVQLGVWLLWIVGGISPLVEDPNRSFDDKMLSQWRAYYELVQFIQNQTPSDSFLLIDSASHINLDLFFLYPRRIIYSRPLLSHEPIDYVVLTGDAAPPAVEGERIMLDANRGLIRLRR